MFSLKSVQIQKNILNDNLIYKLCPSTEFSNGTWKIAIANVSFTSNEALNYICSITCNLVTAQKYSDSFQVEFYEQPLNSFGLKVTDTNPRSIIRFATLQWFTINSLSNELKLSIINIETNEKISRNCNVTVTVLFQRIC